MRSLFLVLAIACLGNASWAQTPTRLSTSNHPFICGYTGDFAPEVVCDPTGQKSNGHAERVVDRILKPIGLVRNFSVIECRNAENCFATVLGGRRFVVYDAAFMQRIEDETETDWSAVSIMAHEIGHHLQGHTIDSQGSQRQKELEADTFSGFVLHQLGASLDESTVAIKILGNTVATPTHPAKSTRMIAIRKGWLEAEELYPKWKPTTPITPSSATAEAPTIVTQYYTDGQLKYQGQVQHNARMGAGTYYFRNGDKYVGPFVNNLPNGKGTYFFADGDRFVGLFKNGKRNGRGILYAADGETEEGTYVNDEKVE